MRESRPKLKFNRAVGNTAEERAEAKLREEKLNAAISYQPRQRYPNPSNESRTSRRRHQVQAQGARSAARRKPETRTRARRSSVSQKGKEIDYDPERGWLTPWKKIFIPVSPAPSALEITVIEKWKEDQKRIRDGPLFVHRVGDENARIGKSTSPGFNVNAFNAMPTWQTTHERKFRVRPNMNGKMWLKQILPQELWNIVDPSLRKDVNTRSEEGTTKRFNISVFNDAEDEERDENAEDDSDAEDARVEEEVDETWSDDEDEGGTKKGQRNDYDAEQYFENGDDDDIEVDDGGIGEDAIGGDDDEREFAPDEEFDV